MWSEDRVEELESRIERNNEQFQQEMEEEVEQVGSSNLLIDL